MTALLGVPPLVVDAFNFRKWTEQVQRIVNRSPIFADTTQVACSGSGETDLFSGTLPMNYLDHNKEILVIRAGGTLANTANNKTIKVKLGSTTLFTTGTMAITDANDWNLEVNIIRVSVASQKAHGTIWIGNNTITSRTDYATGTEDLSTILTFKLTGQGGASNDIVLENIRVDIGLGK